MKSRPGRFTVEMKSWVGPALAALVLSASSGWAQTTWTGAAGASLTTVGNWNNGLPTAANPGTINAGADINFNAHITDYVVTQNGGAVTGSNFRQFNNGSWTMNGGTMTVPSNFQLTTADNTHQDFTITNGTLTLSTPIISSAGTGRTATMNISGGSVSSGNWTVLEGGTVNLDGGVVTSSGTLSVSSGGVFEMTGGTWDGSVAGGNVTIVGSMHISGGDFSLKSDKNLTTSAGGTTTISGGTISLGNANGYSFRGAGAFVFSGGNTTASGNIRCDSGFLLTLGGTSTGSLTTAGWHTTATYRKVDWLPGSKMAMTLTGVANWAETEWAAGRMTYNGQDVDDLGNWAAVTAKGGLGNYTQFVYDAGTKTLSLAYEPPAGMVFIIE